MKEEFIFPFGQKVKKVIQKDRTPKEIFILGVYASAVHAKWVSPDGKEKVRALAVASEPEIFWRGDGAGAIVSEVEIHPELGTLSAADDNFNGPSGKALDEHHIQPLGLERDDVWLCDIYPHTHLNPNQQKAIREKYLPLVDEYSMPVPNIPNPPTKSPGENRISEIISEIVEAKSKIIILLGDMPIIWFLSRFDPPFRRLSSIGKDLRSYGELHTLAIADHRFEVLPLVHPRVAGGLGPAPPEWRKLHKQWVEEKASILLS